MSNGDKAPGAELCARRAADYEQNAGLEHNADGQPSTDQSSKGKHDEVMFFHPHPRTLRPKPEHPHIRTTP
jgi:hypothetical protein